MRKRVTIVCADIRGSTELAGRIDPESLRRVIDRYFARMRVPLERHGGTVAKFIGDAVLAVFGLPRLHGDDALRAVRAAIEMREAVTALNQELERDFGVTIAIGVGVNTGEVVAGDPASGQVFATGEAVNVAARFEGVAKPGEILIGEPTYRLVRDAVRVERCKPLALQGKRGRTEAFRVVDLEPASAHAQFRSESPLAGRKRELQAMVQAFEQVVGTPGCRLLTVIGPAGIGKSRLARELLSVRGGDATLVQGRCLPYGEGITFWPLREAVRQAADLSGLEAPAEARGKIRRLVASASDADLIAERMLETLDLAADTAGSNAIFWATGRLFRELARSQPLIVLFDDVQWAEATFLDLVEYLKQDLRAEPILLLCLARPEFVDLRPSWAAGETNARVLVLEPLPESDSAQLVAGLLGDSDQASHAVARINAATEGNPFFVEELVSMLIEEGRLRRERGSWRPVDELAAISLPPTIGALLAARIDALPSGERAALERASIEGKVFNRDAALRLTPPAEKAAFAVHLDALIRRELIQPTRLGADEDSFEFRHQLLRDAAYEAIPKTRRAQLHERFANWLEQRAGKHTAEYAEILGYHLEQAQRYRTELRPVGETELARRAADYLATAGIRAHARGDMPATVSLVARAVNLLPAESSERRRLTAMHEDALFEIGQLRRTRFGPARMRCFWRWPFGHHWTLRERGGRPVLRCDDCGKTARGYRRTAESAIDRGLTSGWPGA